MNDHTKTMKIKNLRMSGFKNAGTDALLHFEDLNLIRGDNATGKTAVLDAIMLATTGAHPIGKTNKAIMQLARGLRLEACATLTDDTELHAAFEQSSAGRITQLAGKNTGRRFIGSEEFMKATSRGRFEMLAASVDEVKLEEEIDKLTGEISLDNKELKRLDAAIKTHGLELAKLSPAGSSDLMNEADKMNEERVAIRGAINQLSEAGRMDGPLPEGGDLARFTDEEIAESIATNTESVRKLQELATTIPAPEVVEAAKKAAASAKEALGEVTVMRGEWEASLSPRLHNEAHVEHHASTGNIEVFDRLLDTLGVCEGTCPTCKAPITAERVDELRETTVALRSRLKALEGIMDEHACPVSFQEVAAAADRYKKATEKLEYLEGLFELTEKVKGLDEREKILHALNLEAARRKVRAERATFSTSRTRLTEITAWFAEHETTLADTKKRNGIDDEVDKLREKRELLEHQIDKNKKALSTSRVEFNAACAKALGKVLDASKNLLHGIVAGEVVNYGADIFIEREGHTVEVVNYGADIFIEREGHTVSWGAMSGSEQLAIGAAIKAAISTVDGILLVDEIGVLSETNIAKFTDNIQSEILAGRIKQAFVVIPCNESFNIDSRKIL